MADQGTDGERGRGLTVLCSVLIMVLMTGCSRPDDPWSIPLTDLKGDTAFLPASEGKLTVIFFLAPECPLCVNYSKVMRALEVTYRDSAVRFIGVFPGQWVMIEEVIQFRIVNGLEFSINVDDDLRLARSLGASVTPESVLLDSAGRVLYQGAIDNWVNELGKKKLEVTEHYLSDAISAALAGRTPEVRRTVAKGCLIE